MARRPRLLATIVAASASGAASARRSGRIAVGLFLVPVVVMGVVGFAMRGYVEPVFTVGFLDDSGAGSEAAALRAALDAEPTIRIRDYTDREAMRAAVYRGRLFAGVVVPPGWRGERDLELYASAASVGAIVVRAMADARLGRVLVPDARGDVPVRMHDERRESRPPIGFHYTAPSNLVLFLVINGIVSSTGLLMMRRQGITKRLLATPARTSEILLLMLVGPAQVMTVQALFLLGSAALAFDVPWGDPLGVALLTISLIAVGLSLCLFMAVVFRTPEQAFSLAPLIGIAAGMLGGCMWPLDGVPAWLRQAGHALPTAWAMDGYLALIFGHASARDVLPEVAVQLGMALVLFAIGVARVRAEMAR
jgi:ABC-2 type transport system permease protein